MKTQNLNLMLFLYCTGMVLVLIGERLIGGEATLRWVFDAIGALALGGAVLSAKPSGELRDDQRKWGQETAENLHGS